MKPVHAIELAYSAFGSTIDPEIIVDVPEGERCAASGILIGTKGVLFKPSGNFGDHYQMADDGGRFLSIAAAAVMADPVSSNAAGSGVATSTGFERLLSNRSRIAFLVDPPAPPFAVAIVNAKRQHVWWMARTSYDRDLIPMQYGHRQFLIDRPKMLEATRAILAYEAAAQERDGRATHVLVPLGPDQNRDMKHPDFGQPTQRFQNDASPEAAHVRKLITDLSIGDLWAAMAIRAAVRETKTTTIEDALAVIEAQKDLPA